MLKKVISCTLAILMAINCEVFTPQLLREEFPSLYASAENKEYTEGDFTYTVDEENGTASIVASTFDGEILVIPDTLGGYPVTEIGSEVFRDKEITSLQLPDTLRSIKESAFYHCEELESVDLPEGLEEIGGDAFGNCTSLKSVYIPATLTSATTVFRNAPIENVTFSEGIEAIHNRLFSSSGLTEITIPDSVTVIEAEAFDNCTSLKTVKMSENIREIGKFAFYGSAIESIYFPEGLTKIGEHAFSCCYYLTEVNIPLSLTDTMTVSGYEKYGPFSGGDLTNTLDIAYHATHLKKVTLAEGITKIPDCLFNGLWLDEVNIPDTVTEIGDYAYSNSRLPAEITIPDSVEKIGYAAFSYDSLETVHMSKNIKSLGGYAFYDNRSLKSIDLPEGLETIGKSVFDSCESLTDIYLPGTLKFSGEEGESLLSGSGVKNVTFGEDFSKIPKEMFYCCPELESIYIPDSVTEIGERAFGDCLKLSEIRLSENLETIGEGAFNTGLSSASGYVKGCLTHLTLPASVKKASRIINGTPQLEVIEFEEGTTVIPSEVCSGSYIREVIIPEGVTEIENFAFSGCQNLKSVTLPSTVKKIGIGAFSYCKGLEHISLPTGLEVIGNSAFSECSSLTSVTIPEGVKEISPGMFYNCTSLESVYIPDSVVSVDINSSTDTIFGNTSVTLYGDKYSIMAAYASRFNIPYFAISEHLPPTKYLDLTQTSLNIDSRYSINRTAKVTTFYTLDSSLEGMPQDAKLMYQLPDTIEVDFSDITINNSAVSGASRSGNILYIPMRDMPRQGTVRFTITDTGYDTNSITAYFGTTSRIEECDIIGFTSIYGAFEFDIKNETGIHSVNFSGFTKPGSKVNIYVNDELQKTVISSNGGGYFGTVELGAPESRQVFSVTAEEASENGTGERITKTVLYNPMTCDILDTTFIMNGVRYSSNKYFGKRPTVVYSGSGGQFEVEVEVSNPEYARNVFVELVSNDTKGIFNAEWDEERNVFVAKGYMHGWTAKVTAYVNTYISPEDYKISEDELKEEAQEVYDKLSENYDISNPRIDITKLVKGEKVDSYETDGYSTETYNYYVLDGNHQGEIESFVLFTYDLTSKDTGETESVSVVYNDESKDTVELFRELTGYEGDIDQVSSRKLKTDDSSGKTDKAEPYQVSKTGEVGKFGVSIGFSVVGTAKNTVGTAASVTGTALSTIVDTYDTITQENQKRVNQDLAALEANRSSFSESEYNRLKEHIEMSYKALENDKNTRFASLGCIGILTLMGAFYGPEGAVIGLKAGLEQFAGLYIATSINDFIYGQRLIDAEDSIKQGKYGGFWIGLFDIPNNAKNKLIGYGKSLIQGVPINMNTIGDPSGIIYDSRTNEPIYGATVTVYRKDNLEDDDSTAVVWDAAEYDQINPLTTDLNGHYAWDVPEGWYRVKAEADGYETGWSEWLPVPPPQLDVNIGLEKTGGIIYGDADGNDIVNEADIAILQQYLADWKVEIDEQRADADGNGTVNEADVALLQQYLADWKVTLGLQS